MVVRKVKHAYSPERGDIVWLDFDPQRGHEQKGRRPALVLSPTKYNQQTRLVCVCPITKITKGYPFEYPLSLATIAGNILVDQIKSHDWSERQIAFIEKAPSHIVAEVAEIASDFLQDTK
jgi:mRNA interferase MazF